MKDSGAYSNVDKYQSDNYCLNQLGESEDLGEALKRPLYKHPITHVLVSPLFVRQVYKFESAYVGIYRKATLHTPLCLGLFFKNSFLN